MNIRQALLLVVVSPLLLLNSLFSQPPKQNVDLLVTGGTVVTMDGHSTVIEDGAVAVKGDVIAAVGPRSELESKYSAPQIIDARGRLVLPGFINGHTHVPMTLLRGLHDDVTLNDWLYKYIFPAEAKNVNEDFVRWGTHTAEMKKEWDDSQKKNGMSPVQYMESLGILGTDVVSAHCVFVDESDRKILAQRQVGCVHNPSSNMMLASGVSPVAELRAAGVAVGLGTDGPAGSNNAWNLMEEMDLAAKLATITKM